MSHDREKDLASLKALEFIKEGMVVGLGTGTTAGFFIKHLIEKYQQGLQITAVATSIVSEKMAKEGGIPMLDIDTITSIDVTVDGADEVDPKKRLIKGAGGALMREKIIANMSKQMVVITDETKLVEKLGSHPLPVEVIPFGLTAIKKQIEELGYKATWRINKDSSFYLTDNHNRILDLTLTPINEPEKLNTQLLSIPGVVDTGFFFNLASSIIIGKSDGSVEVRN